MQFQAIYTRKRNKGPLCVYTYLGGVPYCRYLSWVDPIGKHFQ